MASLAVDTVERRIRTLLQEQRRLVASLLLLRQQMRGSLFTRYGRCGKAGCTCRTGEPHGPYYVLSTRSAGEGGFTYLERGKMGEMRELVGAYRLFRKGLRQLRTLNGELVRLLARYQQAAARKTERRVILRAS